MKNRRYERRHYRVGDKSQKASATQCKSLIELDFTRATIIIGLICLIQGLLIGRFIKK